jgi:signal transduction histidine kinase
MKNSSNNPYSDLENLDTEILRLIGEENTSDPEAKFYEILRTVISLKIDSVELNHKFEAINIVLTALAIGDFSQKVNVPNRKNIFSHLGTSINAVIDELKVNVVKTPYLEASIEFISDIAIITNKEGGISFVNSVTLKVLEKRKEYLIDLRIANIFESKTQFGISNPDFNKFENIPVKIDYFNVKKDVNLTVKQIFNKLGELDGYLYIAKLI